ncbi:MAG: hypothetical protein HQK60_09050 [Deltaproteobacteria bacterium]|nr:hypothetical protein [Deltaproteobacteria bacterium]
MKIKIKKKQKYKNIYAHLKDKLIQQNIAEPQNILIEPKGELKMSEVLLDFIEPYSKYWETEEQLYKLLTVAIIAWNEALFSGEKRKETLEKAIKLLPTRVHDDARLMIHEMIRRKEKYFADIRRLIVNFEITLTKDGPHVSVASTLESSYPHPLKETR